ncbi:MAG: hypothetical protein A2600_02475 [Candidatus Lambdaproteobacteria bacterium RIFOXYD1_FULL_56_27]|uniref:YggT family protein n=1 Tax=Candidatus Lambdaproteobacteria bacterium RIFOXYD2_FULL_56_26 TaxID=1817773 RepID=A0A1F6H2X8_9PROT|nr:MAG: hypothetical protein A2426_09515 [Candidatus Lambdaproteobacteria bacterium RIFOXYC1_FULL_56_13]OGH04644.1 MAG: hypothetical protein A2557_06540 [Candidatus Lambdaproteobacteria bacterium RIFOXYD2_FULL_56_26]OGH09108.1 MAG: hypothetical protein A2600_02475 [Candidatus Lambdaproteobacteria bacterium RIFOXYD1_FULL_56_27]
MQLILALSEALAWGFKIYGWMIVVAFLLTWVDADKSNGIVRFINRYTYPFWAWLSTKLPRSLVPFAPLVALFLVDFGEIFFPGALRSFGGTLVERLVLEEGLYNLALYFGLATILVARSLVMFLLMLCILYFVFTLVAPPVTNPFVRSVVWMLDPMLRPLQRLLPRAKLDLSPIVLAVGLYLLMTLMAPVAISLQTQLTV